MSIDWSKAPEGCIGAFARIIGNQRTAFFVFSKRPSDYMSREGYEGEGEDGSYHVFSEFWEWLDKPWGGQGLPPPGTEIEYRQNGGTWLAGTYIGEFRSKLIAGCHVTGLVGVVTLEEIRPLRTPEQIAAEGRRNSIIHLANLLIDSRGHCNEYSQAKAIFDAGYRRQEEGK
ncbi:TPA: hypothetical protein NIJ32_002225 [Pseudomonas aeruginosa]|nr:hypothetical protein [Pseudomonas aeruginosa]